MLPGLGMDARMLQPQSNYFQNSFVLKLPEPTDSISLAEYADRIASNWPKQLPALSVAEGIDERKVFLVGVAYGGMLALEIALQIANQISQQASGESSRKSNQIAGVILIGSARTRNNIPVAFRLQEKLIARLPASVGRAAMKRSIIKLASDEGMSIEQKQMLLDTAQESDWNHIRRAANQVAKWDRKGSSFDTIGVPVYQIHGVQDRSIKPPLVSDATLLIFGRHMINLSMATEVNRWIEAILRDYNLNKMYGGKAGSHGGR